MAQSCSGNITRTLAVLLRTAIQRVDDSLRTLVAPRSCGDKFEVADWKIGARDKWPSWGVLIGQKQMPTDGCTLASLVSLKAGQNRFSKGHELPATNGPGMPLRKHSYAKLLDHLLHGIHC